jgi:branched-chain amino acid transport system permease protein
MQSLIGPAIAAFVLVAVPELLRFFTEWRLIIYGLLFVIIMIFKPQGLLGYTEMNFTYTWSVLKNFFKKIFGKKEPKTEGGDR